MKKYALIFVHVAFASLLLAGACKDPMKSKLEGKWRAKEGKSKLTITEKGFALDEGEAIAEDYFVKGDTIFTSFQGNQPYTSFIVQNVDDHNLRLMGPDSVAMEFSR